MTNDDHDGRTSGTRLSMALASITAKGGSDVPVVVLAEDERDLRTVIADCLLAEGYVVLAVPCVEHLQRAMGAVTAAAIVVDLNLGTDTSEGVIDELVRSGRGAAIVLVSAAANARAVARKHGVRLVAKPFELDELVEAVHEAAQSQQHAERASRTSRR